MTTVSTSVGVTATVIGGCLAYFETPRQPMTSPGAIVLRELRSGSWATHELNLEAGGYSTGHYFDNLAEARRDFSVRVARWIANYNTIEETTKEPTA